MNYNNRFTRFILLALAAIAVITFFLSGCKTVAYNQVAKDMNISARNKKILLYKCDAEFPQPAPIYIKGDTVIKTDTTTIIQFDTIPFLDTFYIVKHDTKYITRVEMINDTIIKYAGYKGEVFQLKIREIEKENDKINNANEVLKTDLKKANVNKRWGWVFSFILILLYGIKIYFTKKL